MSPAPKPDDSGTAGMAVDASGKVAYDPSKNVLDLVRAAVERIDDMAQLRAELADEKILRIEREASLRADHTQEVRGLESDRLDKIRSVDVANAAATAAQLLSAVTTLATTQQATAETLRNQVAATASAVASQTERVINPIIERLSLLERATASTSGKSDGFSQGWAILTGAIILALAIYSGVFKSATAPAAVAPQVIYVPAPAAGSGAPLPGTTSR